jgi:hypothetical protein
MLKPENKKTVVYVADFGPEDADPPRGNYYRFTLDADLLKNGMYSYVITAVIEKIYADGDLTVGRLEDFLGLFGSYDIEWYQEGYDEEPKDFFFKHTDIEIELYPSKRDDPNIATTEIL